MFTDLSGWVWLFCSAPWGACASRCPYPSSAEWAGWGGTAHASLPPVLPSEDDLLRLYQPCHVATPRRELACNSRLLAGRVGVFVSSMSFYTSRVLAACTKGDIALLHRISKETSLSKCLDKFGASPVHYAVRSGKKDCLQWLVMVAGLSPTTPALNGATPVHDAAATGQLNCLEWLVQKGKCDPNARDCAQATPLHLAARFGHLPVVEWLVRVEKCSPMERAQNGATPVHLAAAKGSMNCLKWLTKMEPRYTVIQLCVGALCVPIPLTHRYH